MPTGRVGPDSGPVGGPGNRRAASDALDWPRSGVGAEAGAMSRAPAAKVEPASARGVDRDRQPARVGENRGTRGWTLSASSAPDLWVGRADDAHEAWADRVAQHALSRGTDEPGQHATATRLITPPSGGDPEGLRARVSAAVASCRAVSSSRVTAARRVCAAAPMRAEASALASAAALAAAAVRAASFSRVMAARRSLSVAISRAWV